MVTYDIQFNGDLRDLLFEYCKRHIKISYNSVKNYCGELCQCVVEIKRKLGLDGGYAQIPSKKTLSALQKELFLQSMQLVNIKADGDLNYILFRYAKYSVGYTQVRFYCDELLNTVTKIEENILADYEELKIVENGDV